MCIVFFGVKVIMPRARFIYLAMEKAMAAWPVLTSQRNFVPSPSGRFTSQSRNVGWKNISEPSDLQKKLM